MLIAQQKQKENIIEYLLYMWQLEDILRATNFDIKQIEKLIISQYDVDADTTLEVFKWISADEHPAQDGRFINIVSVPVGEDFSPGSSTVYVDAEVPDVYAVRVKSRGNVHGSTTTYALKLEAL